MSARVQSAVSLVSETEEALRELPMPVIAYFIITFVLFLGLLGVTWSFRNTAYKVQAPRPSAEQQGTTGTPGNAVSPDGSHH